MTEEKQDGADSNHKKEAPMTFLEKIFSEDLIGPWIDHGLIPQYYEFNKTGLLVMSRFAMNLFDVPWLYVTSPFDRHCSWYKHIDACHDFIPKKCMHCWKVVVMPKTLKALFQLLSIERKMVEENPYCYCKCGIETRGDVERNYGGYFYTNSLKEGLIRLEEVREKVYPVLGDDTTVILKRSCTEYERKYGPSNQWDSKRTEQHEIIEERLNQIFKVGYEDLTNPDLMQAHTMVKWIKFAADRGDPTIPELNGGRRIYPGYVTYEQKSKEDGNGMA